MRSISTLGRATSQPCATSSPGEAAAAVAVAVGDLDGDGLPDIVTGGNNQDSMVTLNRSRRGSGQADVLKLAALARPDGAPDAAHYASPVILQNQRIPITYTLYGPADCTGRSR